MEHLVDTNVLLRWSQPDHPDYPAVRLAIETLQAEHELCVGSQNLVEFWNVATRPRERNGFGLNHQAAANELEDLESFFKLLPDEPAVYRRWKRLVLHHQVSGAKAHDARLVAVMLVHGVNHVLTFNEADFARYTGITAVNPADVLAHAKGSAQESD